MLFKRPIKILSYPTFNIEIYEKVRACNKKRKR